MDASDVWTAIAPWLVSGVGGAIGAALILPTKLGDALIKFKLDKALEQFKNDQAHLVERLREQLNHLSDRGKRSNEKEFAAIQECWELIVEAYLKTASAVINSLEFPPLNLMSPEQLDRFLSQSDLSKEDQEHISGSTDKNKAYSEAVVWRQIIDARRANYDVNLFLRKQKVFMPGDLANQFASLIELLNAAEVQRRLQYQHRDIPRTSWGKSIDKFLGEGDKILDNLGSAVRARLFRSESQGP